MMPEPDTGKAHSGGWELAFHRLSTRVTLLCYRDDSVVKRVTCSHRGSVFDSRHPHEAIQTCLYLESQVHTPHTGTDSCTLFKNKKIFDAVFVNLHQTDTDF